MGLDLLDTPVRLTWDFPEETLGQVEPCLPAIAGALADGGVFFVTLQGRPLLHPALTEVLEILNGACQLLITCHGSSEELLRLTQLSRGGYTLLLDCAGFVGDSRGVDREGLLAVVQTLRKEVGEPVLTLTPLRNNLRNIPDLLRFCSEQQLAKFKLSNAHIGDSFRDYSIADLPRWQDLAGFRKLWLDFVSEGCSLPALEIHDLFLWEIMTPGEQQNRSEYGGCQAGNSLGHVDSLGVVHPCAAWPQPLGVLPAQALADIWAGTARLAVRDHVARAPVGCCDCTALGLCFGGCRGLAFHLNQSEGERDLLCSGPR